MRACPSVASVNWLLWLALPSMLAGYPHPSSLMPVGLPHASKQSANSILRIRILWNHFSSLLRDLIDFAIMRHNTTHLSATPLLLFTSLIFSCLHFFCLVLSCHVLSCLVFFSLHYSSLLHHLPESGDGNFHVLLMLRADVPEDVKEAHRLAGDIATAAISMGGTCTGEHGESCSQIGRCEALHRRTPNISFLYLPLSSNLS